MMRLPKLLACDKGARITCLLLSLFLWGSQIDSFAATIGSVCFKQTCFQPEVARTQAEKQNGLMERVRLMSGQGMLFVYDREGQPVFWMKNMRMPLDFIWLDRNNRVVDVSENVPVCATENCPTLTSRKPVQYVLEVSSGAIRKSGIQIGDQAVMKLGENR